MGKVKSAIVLTVITLVIAVLCVVCFVPFPTDSEGVSFFNPILNWTQKSSELGGYQYGGNAAYLGGGYTAVLYPEGVLSKKEYEANLAGKETEAEKQEYAEDYLPYANGALYLERDVACEKGSDRVSEEFDSGFRKNVEILKQRFEGLRENGTKLEVCDDYSVRIQLSSTMSAPSVALLYFSYLGDFTVKYGSSYEDATQAIPAENSDKPLSDYVKSSSVRTLNGVIYVVIHFTSEGRDIISEVTSGAADSAITMYFSVGDQAVINLSVSDQIVDGDLYISGSYTDTTAGIVATVIDSSIASTALGGESVEMNLGEIYRMPAATDSGSGLSALMLFYIAIGGCMLLSAAFFLIRYRRLGFAAIYSMLCYVILMVLCMYAIPVEIGLGTALAFLLCGVLLGACNAVAFEYARKEYAVGKTIVSSVKTGYRKCFWHIFDLHIALAIVAVLTYLIATAELASFALVMTLGVLISGVCTLVFNRFFWFIMMPLSKNAGKFCHYKREEVEDDE